MVEIRMEVLEWRKRARQGEVSVDDCRDKILGLLSRFRDVQQQQDKLIEKERFRLDAFRNSINEDTTSRIKSRLNFFCKLNRQHEALLELVRQDVQDCKNICRQYNDTQSNSYSRMDGICRRMEFLDCIQDKYMNGTLIRTYTTFADLCEINCFKEIACLSYNLGPIDSQTGMRLCELNYAETSTSASPPVEKTGFMYCQASSVCSSNPCEAPLSCTPSFVAPHDTPVCIQSCTTQRPLGMESGEIPDPSVTASSYWYNRSDHAPWLARLHGTRPVGSWSSQYNKKGEYLQVDVGRVVHLTMVWAMLHDQAPFLGLGQISLSSARKDR
ncbi:predicted protein [Nematostella vectensis]|uniref:F5/8 type C domain-containing protein n=1 Tax=Nematostella vectensis TaxID=45351 RepID=A7T1C6_NEMVE|nr:predicted protein [Nematostella vectensis]|eukprot:XP_001622338.1 hypothetical protein NEMVEDRAFT_v1g220854 [Nematostella vectensis]